MATNLVVNFIGKNNLSKTTAVMSRDLQKFGLLAKNVGKSLNNSFGALGVGFGLAALTNGLKNATKAASDDRKSQGLLANALQNTVGATASAIASAEQYIKRTQLQTSVLDDELRPALATAVRGTGSLAGGQRLLDAALNLSASTGKNLGTVTGALSKAYNGNTGALKKLVPGLKLTADVIGDVEKGFAGAAEKAAKLDPYKRLQVIFQDIQETIGAQLLPALEEFSTYIVSPEGQTNLKQIVDLFVSMGKAIGQVITFLIKNILIVKLVVGAVIALKVGWLVVTGIIKLYTLGVISATVATKALKVALISTGIGAIAVAVGLLAEAWINASAAQDDYVDGQPSDVYIPSENPYQIELDRNIQLTKDKVKKAADALKAEMDKKAAQLKKTAENFRDSIGLAFGTFGKDENTVFNADVVISKLKRMVDAAKGFAENIKKLKKGGAGADVINEIVGMGPAQGNIVAKGLLSSGKLSQYLALRGSLYGTGTQVATAGYGTQEMTYSININKANVSAEDIIKAVRDYEKKTGRKYFATK
jgi:hypothetical protein